jgi:3'-5' exoribonuclease
MRNKMSRNLEETKLLPKITDLGEFSVIKKELKKTLNNSDFVKLIVQDKLSSYCVFCFKNPKYYFDNLELSDRISITGYFYDYKGITHIKAFKIIKISFVGKYIKKLKDLVEKIVSRDCRLIIESFLNDETFMKKFITTPASLNSHHSFKGGLLYHTVNSMELGLKMSETDAYKGKVNLDILLTGLFLHDIGKIYSYSDGNITVYEKKLGHIAIGEKIFLKQIEDIRHQLDINLIMDLIHIILTHHNLSQYLYGIKPVTNEAKLVNKLESLDAEIEEMDLKSAS